MRCSKLAVAAAFALLAAGVFVVVSFDDYSEAAVTYEFKTTDVSGYPGETVPVEVYIDSNPGISLIGATITFDPSKIQYQSSGSGFSPNWTPGYVPLAIVQSTPGKITITWDDYNLAINTSTGTVLTLMFEIIAPSESIILDFDITEAAMATIPTITYVTSDTSIEDATVTSYALPTAYSGQTLSDIPLSSGYSWVSPLTSVVTPSNKTFRAAHNGVEFDLEIGVGKANITASLKSGTQYAYTGAMITPAFGDLVLPGGAAASDVVISSSASDWNAGTTVTVTVAASAGSVNFQGSDTFTFVIQRAPGSVSITTTSAAMSKTYDGSSVPDPAYTSTGDGSVTFQWLRQGSSTPLAGAPADAGSYSVTAVAAQGTNHLAADSTPVSFTISKAAGSVTVTSDPSKTYDGAAASAPSYTRSGDGAVTIEWYSGATKLASAPVNAGSYSARVVVAEGTNHTGAFADAAFAISKAAGSASITSLPAAIGKTYNGSPVSNPVYTREGDGAVTFLWYEQGNPTPLAGPPTTAGNYSVAVRVAEGSNHLAADSPQVSFTISKATSSVTVSGSPGRAYNGSPVSNPSYGGTGDGAVTFQWYEQGNPTPLAGAPTEAGSYSVTAVRAEGTNYLGSQSASLNFTISKAAGSVTITSLPAAIGKTYDGIPVSDPAYSSTGDGVVTFLWYAQGSSTPLASAPANAGSYTVRAAVSEGTNHLSAQSALVSFTIARAAGSVAITSDPSKTFDGSPASAPGYTSTGDGAVTFEWYSGATRLASAPTNAGSYIARAVLSTGTNYAGASDDMAFTIAKAMPTLSGVSSTQIITGQTLAASVITGTASVTGVPSIPGSYAWDLPGRNTVLAVGDSGTVFPYTFTPSSANYDQAVGTLAVTVKSADSTVTPVYTMPVRLYASGTLPAISTSAGNTPGAIAWDVVYPLAPGSQQIKWVFTPTDLVNFTVKEGWVTFNVLRVDLSSIAVTTPPTKTSYVAFEPFDPTGMVITATFNDGSTSDVTAGCSMTPAQLTAGLAKMTASYTDVNNITRTADIAITVSKATPSVTPQYTAPPSIHETGALPALSHTGTPGAISWDAHALTVGTGPYGWTFVPDDEANYTQITGSATFTILADTLDDITVGSLPLTVDYADGDAFDADGMVIVAGFLSGNAADVTGYTVTPAALSYGDTFVTVSYVFNGVTETVTVGITVKYGVMYTVNGGVVFKDLYDPGDPVTVRPNLSRAGYTTTAWSVPQALGAVAGAFFMPAANVDITATQTPIPNYYFVVRYDANGGSFGSAPSPASVLQGATIDVQFSNLPQRTGYDFEGWSTSPNANSAQYSGSASVRVNSDVTFFAVWKAKQPQAPPVPPTAPATGGEGVVVSGDVLLILAVALLGALAFGGAVAVFARRRQG